ncbi:hypothetical protein [Adlercreutzia sp. ZJ304]|nr:hypothetical protein [Adlercreutzia sp. ZJ304]
MPKQQKNEESLMVCIYESLEDFGMSAILTIKTSTLLRDKIAEEYVR